ncbi:hypothetical protein Aperf_G00000071524 [Anoplocephala perfoliata]
MSDIDDINIMESSQCDQSTYVYPSETPLSPTMRSTKPNQKRKHKRSVSEQIFSKAGYIRERLHRHNNSSDEVRMCNRGRNKKESSGGGGSVGGGSVGGGSLFDFETGWKYEDSVDQSTYCGDFSPFQSSQDSAINPSPSGRCHSGKHLRRALKRSVKKALSSSRAGDEGIIESSQEDNSTGTWDLQNRYKRMSDERNRHQRRTSSCSDYMRDSVPSFKSVVRWYINVPPRADRRHAGRAHDLRHSVGGRRIDFNGIDVAHDEKYSGCKRVLQIMEKHKVRSDKLIGRAYLYLHGDETACSYEVPVKYFSLRKGGSQELGTIGVEISVEPDFFFSNDGCIPSPPPGYSEKTDEMASETTTISYIKKLQKYKKLSSMLTSSVHLPSFNRPALTSLESSVVPSAHSADAFYFSPYEVTRRYLGSVGAVPTANVPWRPFLDWPGQRCLESPMMAFKGRFKRAYFWDLRIPKISWPIEFLLPMARLGYPSAEMVDTLDVGDTVKVIKIVESGFVNIYLVGVRGLKSIPQVEMVGKSGGLDDWDGGVGGNNVDGLVPGSLSGESPAFNSSGITSVTRSTSASLGSSCGNITSPETHAATLVALHWATKSLTLQPSPQVEFTYGREKKSSSIVKNNSNPNFLEEFEFGVRNGSPRFIRITIYDRETRPGTSGIPRSPILGESVIDLNDMPLEITQKMELQLLRNSNDARILMFVTITGLTTGTRSPVQNYFEMSRHCSTISTASAVTPFSSSPISDDGGKVASGETSHIGNDDKSDLPNSPATLLQHVSAYYSFRKSFTNSQDVGWMRLKICSAMGLGGKSANGRIELFCAVDMFNIHLRTQSIIKHKYPTWNRYFVLPLSDINGVVKITVVEVEKNKAEIIGGLAIHPLRVVNGGSKWYALKTPDFRSPTNGSILLEFDVVYNKFKSALKSFSPMEPRYRSMAKKQKSIISTIEELLQRFENLKLFLESIRRINETLDDWWLWKNPTHSILGLIGYQLLVFYFQPYFIPLFMVLVLLKNRFFKRKKLNTIIHNLMHVKTPVQLASSFEHEIYRSQHEMLERSQFSEQRLQNEEEGMNPYIYTEENILESTKLLFSDPQGDLPGQEEEEDERSPAQVKLEGNKTVRLVRNAFKEKTRLFELLENTASIYERVEGLFNWRIPWLSSLFVIVLLLITIALFFVPVKYLLMLYGFSKFTKAILRPNALRHNELMDILSRVPDLVEAAELIEYRPDVFTIPLKGRPSKT